MCASTIFSLLLLLCLASQGASGRELAPTNASPEACAKYDAMAAHLRALMRNLESGDIGDASAFVQLYATASNGADAMVSLGAMRGCGVASYF